MTCAEGCGRDPESTPCPECQAVTCRQVPCMAAHMRRHAEVIAAKHGVPKAEMQAKVEAMLAGLKACANGCGRMAVVQCPHCPDKCCHEQACRHEHSVACFSKLIGIPEEVARKLLHAGTAFVEAHPSASLSDAALGNEVGHEHDAGRAACPMCSHDICLRCVQRHARAHADADARDDVMVAGGGRSCVAGCGKKVDGYVTACPRCELVACSQECANEHGVWHMVRLGMTEDEARAAMECQVGSPEELAIAGAAAERIAAEKRRDAS